jgi:hypothetical protein
MTMRCLMGMIVALATSIAPAASAQWQTHEVRQVNGRAAAFRLPAKLSIVTEKWNRVVAVPYIVYMPEKDRLLMLVACDYPHCAFVLTSDDRGATWTEPRPVGVDAQGKPSVSMGTSLAYLGGGRAMLYSGSRWFTEDFGQTWGNPVAIAPTPEGKPWYTWDPPLVERDATTGKVTRLVETGYTWWKPPEVQVAHQQGYIRSSTDEGKTWSEAVKVPEWQAISEVALLRAANGDLVAACRTDMPRRMEGDIDHAEGLGVSISKDNGRTWSAVEWLYEWGRHHPAMILMPNGDIVMTYVVRRGYTADKDGFPRFGIEAITSRDHGRTWDLDHRYILHSWTGKRKGDDTHWWPSSQATSSVPLADGSILTAFGTGYRVDTQATYPPSPRDVGLIQWRLNPEAVNDDRTIRDAAFDSDRRNVFNP